MEGYGGGSLWVEVNDNGTKKLYAAGYNGNGVLGIGGIVNAGALTSLSVLDGKGIKKVECHSTSALFVTDNGELWGAGYNDNGALGIDFIGSSSLSQSKYADGTIISSGVVDAIVDFQWGVGVSAWFLRNDGTVWGSGSNNESQLCNGASGSVTKFRQVLTAASTPITGITKIISVGRGQLFMLKSDGTVWATGRNHDAVFGNSAFPRETAIGNFAKQIQTGIEDMWTPGTNVAGYCLAFWKKGGKYYFSGYNGNYIGGAYTETLTTGYYNFLQPINFFDDKTIVDIKLFNRVAENGDNYRCVMFLTDESDIYLTGISGHCHLPDDGDDIQLKMPYKLTDYLGNSNSDTVFINKIETNLPSGTANGQVLTFDGTAWVAKTFVPDTQTTVTKVTGQWTLAPGTSNVSFTVPFNQVVNAFVLGNIPNGIITYTGTFVVTNGNVNAVGNQYAWSYDPGAVGTLELLAIPDQIVGTSGIILKNNGTIGAGRVDANVMRFRINNKTSSNVVVNWGYVPLSA